MRNCGYDSYIGLYTTTNKLNFDKYSKLNHKLIKLLDTQDDKYIIKQHKSTKK